MNLLLSRLSGCRAQRKLTPERARVSRSSLAQFLNIFEERDLTFGTMDRPCLSSFWPLLAGTTPVPLVRLPASRYR